MIWLTRKSERHPLSACQGRPATIFARGALTRLLLIALISGLLAPAALRPPRANAELIQGAPDTLVSTDVRDFTLAGPKVFWLTTTDCPLTQPDKPPVYNEAPEIITRVAAAGGQTRKLLDRIDPHGPNSCNPYKIRSNIIADDNYVYFVDPSGLVRLSTNANVDDPVELLSAGVIGSASAPAELAQDSTTIYAITKFNSTASIRYVSKQGGTAPEIATESSARKLAADGENVYWLNASGALRRYRLSDHTTKIIASGIVTAFYAEGPRTICVIGCVVNHYVYIGKGRDLFFYNNTTETMSAPLYHSATSNAAIYSITLQTMTIYNHAGIFWLESRPIVDPDSVFQFFDQVLLRQKPLSAGSADTLYDYRTDIPGRYDVDHLLSSDGLVFWQEVNRVRRMPIDVAALPMTNMAVTGIEVTQGIQDINNSILLIKGRRTFVRAYVKAAGPDVKNVTAQLYATWDGGGAAGPILPVNPVGTYITVKAAPSRDNINDSFLFELPWSWLEQPNLRLRAELNPNRVPQQQSYDQNTKSIGPLVFKPSPRLEVQFVSWKFVTNTLTFEPRYKEDILQTYSWIRRAYPLASSALNDPDPGPGFRPRPLMVVQDDDMVPRIERRLDECKVLVFPETCASTYANFRMQGWKDESGDSAFYYGMISDGYIFPRGIANGKGASTGPAGVPGPSMGGWDTDTTYADWYAGHEIGHSLGRNHPNAGSDDPATKKTSENCGHSRSDSSYPYGNTSSAAAPIGPASGILEGFDAGDPAFGITKSVYPSALWNDMMSYCTNQWISDYTYLGMYNTMIQPAALVPATPSLQAIGAGYLGVYGVIAQDSSTAKIFHMQRMSQTARLTSSGAGRYSLQLRDGAGSVLIQQQFTPDGDKDSPDLSFSRILPFATGTHELRLVDLTTGKTLYSQPISANSPQVSSASLTASALANPTVTLTWSSADADGDALTHDIYYSRDNKSTFQPLRLNISGNSATIDTGTLGGGTVFFRVVASDGVQTSQLDSTALTIANKPPQPRILSPDSGTRIHYGQLVNFSGTADDPQGEDVSLTWRNQKGVLGSGSLLSVDNLPVGTNTITLTAVNHAGLLASSTITIVVDDDMNPLGPTLSVGPGMLNWQVAAGTTQQQQATLNISNVGSGVLTWVASSDAPWLTLSATSGSTPAALTLSANPSGVSPGTTATARVTLAGKVAGQVVQTIKIPVSLSVGDVWHTDPTPQPDKTPPVVTCSVSPNVLQPADGRLVPVSATVNVVDDLSGPAGFILVSVEGNEDGADSGILDFKIGTSDTTGTLRAEHAPMSNGRVYTLTYRGMDLAGNTATCITTVSVPNGEVQ
ncbi:MAG: BACON domain-containing protein [Roseiflexaceae bacterium]